MVQKMELWCGLATCSLGVMLFNYQTLIVGALGTAVALYGLFVPARQFLRQRRDQIRLQLETDLARMINAIGIVDSALWALSRSDMLVCDGKLVWTWKLDRFDARLAEADAAYFRALEMIGDTPLDYSEAAFRVMNQFGLAIAHARDARGYVAWLADNPEHQTDQMRESGENVWRAMKQRLADTASSLRLAEEEIQKRVVDRARRDDVHVG